MRCVSRSWRSMRWTMPGPRASRDAFMAGYRQAPVRAITVDPRSSGIGPVGHMGYFRPQARTLWDDALDWFDGVLAAPGQPAQATS